MRETPTIEAYVAAVREALSDVPARRYRSMLAELERALREDAATRGETAALDAAGSPQASAAAIRAAVDDGQGDAEPQGRVLGMPYDFRGLSTERIAERLWNPADPRVLVPRLFGVGWTLNFGAIAVKLGLMRPDDTAEETFDRVPSSVANAVLAVPAVLAGACIVLVVVAWRSLPAQVPVHWGLSGAPDRWASKEAAFGTLLALGVVPVVLACAALSRRTVGRRARVLWAAALGLLASVALGVATITVADASGGNSGDWMWVIVGGGAVVSFLLVYVPARIGVRIERCRDLGAARKGDG